MTYQIEVTHGTSGGGSILTATTEREAIRRARAVVGDGYRNETRAVVLLDGKTIRAYADRHGRTVREDA